MKEKYDLAVAYRICPRISKPIAIYSNDKLKLAEFCLKSFKNSLGPLKAKIWVLLDNCPSEYEDLFLKYFNKEDLSFIKLNGVGNQATFDLQLEILTKQNDADIVYFAEDDYFFLPNQFTEMVEFLKSQPNVHFVSPYDHPDYYFKDIHKHKYEIRAFAKHHWRTAASTTLSFLTSKEVLTKTKNVFRKYRVGAPDYCIWMSITKYNVLNPFRILKYMFSNRVFFVMMVRAWIYCWRQNLFGKRWKLWVPIPTIATHMEKRVLSPCVDWEKEFGSA
jgi:hypothetical protein